MKQTSKLIKLTSFFTNYIVYSLYIMLNEKISINLASNAQKMKQRLSNYYAHTPQKSIFTFNIISLIVYFS